jgi:preprotein translocase subunit SecG
MNTRWMIVIVAIMIALVIVLQVLPKHYDEATGQISIRKPKPPKQPEEDPEEIPGRGNEPVIEAN